mgnify:CR=1 FL=1
MTSKLCTHTGCKNIVRDGGNRCPDHVQPSYTPKREYSWHFYNGRNIYKSSRWVKLRAHHLRLHPCCVMCEQFNIYEPATVVDHIKEVKDGGDPWDMSNLQSLCRSHHQTKTGQETKKRNQKKSGFRGLGDF